MEKDFKGIPDDNPPPYYSTAPPPYGPMPDQPIGFVTPQNAPQPQVVQVIIGDLGKDSRRMTCPHCHADIATKVKYREGTTTHIAALLLCIIGGIFCCWIPYCVDDCKDAHHECPNCNMQIGSSRG